MFEEIKTIDDVLNEINNDIDEPKVKPPKVTGFNTFADLYSDLTDAIRVSNKPVIVRTDIMRSIKNHDWFKEEFENEKVDVVYILDPIADVNYLSSILEEEFEDEDYDIHLRHRKEVFDKEYGVELPFVEIEITKKVVI